MRGRPARHTDKMRSKEGAWESKRHRLIRICNHWRYILSQLIRPLRKSEARLLKTEHGLGPFWNRCFLCGTDLELNWPDLAELNPSDIKNHAFDDWRQAATRGCSFCNIIITVIDDAGIKHDCSVPNDSKDDYRLNSTGSPTGNDTKGFQVILARNKSTGRYLLALELIWMPLWPKDEGQSEFWGTITVYLDGTLFLPMFHARFFASVAGQKSKLLSNVPYTTKWLMPPIGPDELKLNLEPFIKIPKTIDSPEGLKFARDWLTKCQKDHPQCSLIPRANEALSPSSNVSVRILQIHEDTLILKSIALCGEIPDYVALSHCWGSSPTLKTLSTNIERFQMEIQIQDLPATFKDAIRMTKWLGFQYIWIDSLCIIQDSLADWEVQSSLMASVYGNAELVLAASSASSSEEGFLKERTGYRETSLRLRGGKNKKSVLNLKYRLLNPVDLFPLLDPLEHRAWTLQERLMARRYLAIGSYDTTWACTTCSACECEWWRVASIWRNELTNIERVLRNTTIEGLAQCWRENVLRHYCGRNLTVPSDNLVAVSAIASVFQAKSGQDYYAGIWQGDLIPGLLWSASEGRDTAYVLDDSAPSWSWASLSTLKFCPHFNISATSKTEELARVLKTKTTTSTGNRFGSVHSSFTNIWGVIWTAEISSNSLLFSLAKGREMWIDVKGYFTKLFMLHFDTALVMVDVCLPDGTRGISMRRARREEVQGRFYIGNLPRPSVIPVLMIPLLNEFHTPKKLKKTRTSGLIVGRSHKHPARFVRLGYFVTDNVQLHSHPMTRPEDLMGESCEQEIVII